MASGVGILMYHAVVAIPLRVPDWCFLDAASFEAQVGFLRERCDVIPLSEVAAKLRRGRSGRPAVAITFDDGFQNNHDVALPILRDAGLPATVFLVTGLLGTDDTPWYCRLHHALEQTHRPAFTWGELDLPLGDAGLRADASATLQRSLKTLPHPELLAAVRGIVRDLGGDPDAPIAPTSPYRMLDLPAIRAMLASGLIELGAHTRSHAILSLLPAESQRREIAESVHRVAELSGGPCRVFAYPNGRRMDYDAAGLACLNQLGVELAVTAETGISQAETPRLELLRLGIGGLVGTDDFAALRAWVEDAGS